MIHCDDFIAKAVIPFRRFGIALRTPEEIERQIAELQGPRIVRIQKMDRVDNPRKINHGPEWRPASAVVVQHLSSDLLQLGVAFISHENPECFSVIQSQQAISSGCIGDK